MFFLSQILIAIVPVFLVFLLAYRASKFIDTFNKKRVIRERNLIFKKISDYFPKNFKKKLKSPEILDRFLDDVMSQYNKLFHCVLGYILFWASYIILLGIRVFNIFIGDYNGRTSEEIGYVIGSIIMSVMITYWLLLLPLFEYFHVPRLVKIGYDLFELFRKLFEVTNAICLKAFKYFIEFSLSFIPLIVYIRISVIIITISYIEATVWLWIILFMLYMYIILKFVGSLIMKIVNLLSKKCIRIGALLRYVDKNIIYLLLKNCTYLSMVVIYVIYSDMEGMGNMVASAMGVLFLLDTFFNQEKDIQKKITERKQ